MSISANGGGHEEHPATTTTRETIAEILAKNARDKEIREAELQVYRDQYEELIGRINAGKDGALEEAWDLVDDALCDTYTVSGVLGDFRTLGKSRQGLSEAIQRSDEASRLFSRLACLATVLLLETGKRGPW
jgi:hypothetical protein